MAAYSRRVYKFTKVQHPDPLVDRIQDQIVQNLNSTLLLGTSAIQGAAIPPVAVSNNGQFIQYNSTTNQFQYTSLTTGGALGTPTSGHILVANGTNWVSVAMSGDATIASSGALTLAGAAHAWALLSSFTAHNLAIGNGSSAPTMLAPGTTAFPLVSQGTGADPHWALLTVPGGGTGAATFNAYGVLTGGTTATAAIQSVTPNASTAFALISGGASALPSWALLTVPGGGTGVATILSNALVVGQGAAAVTTSAAPSIVGQYPYWNGTAWVMTPANSAEGASLDSFPQISTTYDDEFEASTLASKWLPFGAQTSITDGTVTWIIVYPWAPYTNFSVNTNNVIAQSGNIYTPTTPGVSYGGPTGTSGSPITEPGTGTPVTWTYKASPTYIWQAGKSYAQFACIINPTNGVMWCNFAAGAITAGATMPAGLAASTVSTNSASPTTVADNGGTWTQVFLWQPNTAYSSVTPSYVQSPNGGLLYVCSQTGTSWNGPTVGSSTQTDNGVTWTFESTPVVGGAWSSAGVVAAKTSWSFTGTNGNTYYWYTVAGGTSGKVIPTAFTTTGLAIGSASPNVLQTPWNPNFAYQVGQLVVNQGNLYCCITAGTSHLPNATGHNIQTDTAGPFGTTLGADITDGTAHWVWVQGAGISTPPAWTISTAVKVGTVVTNSGGVYICITAGTTAGSGGPTGTTNGQTDNTATWNYVGGAPPTAFYSTAQRPGSLLVQGNQGAFFQRLPGPNTYFVWCKVGISYRPGDTIMTSEVGARIELVDNMYGNSNAIISVGGTANASTFGTGQTLVFQVIGPTNSSIGQLAQSGYKYVWNLQALPSTTAGSSSQTGFPLGMWSKTICYLGLLVQQNGSTGTVVTGWCAGSDRVWFQPPPLYSASNWLTITGSQGGGAWGAFSGAQFNYAALFVRNVVPASDPTGGLSAITNTAQYEFFRCNMNTLTLP